MPLVGLLVALALIGLSITYWYVTLPLLGVGLAFAVSHYWRRDQADFALPDEERLALWEKRKTDAVLRREHAQKQAAEAKATRARAKANK